MRYKRSGFAGVIILAALGLSSASAGSIYFTANGTGTLVYAPWNLTGGIFGFVYEYFILPFAIKLSACKPREDKSRNQEWSGSVLSRSDQLIV
jgi:hypothetical protein